MGFVVVEGRDDDIIVFEEDLNCALDKDEVEVEIIGRDRDRKKGRIVKVLKRNKTQFVGSRALVSHSSYRQILSTIIRSQIQI